MWSEELDHDTYYGFIIYRIQVTASLCILKIRILLQSELDQVREKWDGSQCQSYAGDLNPMTGLASNTTVRARARVGLTPPKTIPRLAVKSPQLQQRPVPSQCHTCRSLIDQRESQGHERRDGRAVLAARRRHHGRHPAPDRPLPPANGSEEKTRTQVGSRHGNGVPEAHGFARKAATFVFIRRNRAQTLAAREPRVLALQLRVALLQLHLSRDLLCHRRLQLR